MFYHRTICEVSVIVVYTLGYVLRDDMQYLRDIVEAAQGCELLQVICCYLCREASLQDDVNRIVLFTPQEKKVKP